MSIDSLFFLVIFLLKQNHLNAKRARMLFFGIEGKILENEKPKGDKEERDVRKAIGRSPFILL
jgi:hypothetical protein